ncbi:hypothetical protein LTR56_002964 [Elasticomyces elasticus]|nr:hypothetical protein LTR22_014687 [Elasticomyces elasticus]KAK3656616.1 hypothetical protein LTR56_002964 [Elasticomyces elasticus]KAK4930748.1 hypothetical protein LTR49_002836 [Elasticomyces elasticus]KAK5755623.1 hypothetical protein LTS12_014282 [Elasticomyces elasticus]
MYIAISNDSLAGLSGNDSWQRAWLLPFDSSAAAIFSFAIFLFAFRPDSRRLRRWRQLHSQFADVRFEYSLSIRSPLTNIWNTSKRYTRLTSTECPPQGEIKRFARQSNLPQEVQFVANSSHFFVPYMRLDRPEGEAPYKIVTNLGPGPEKIKEAAACSIARFATFTATIIIYAAIRTVLLYKYVSGNTAWCVFLVSTELGRIILAWCQEASVMTYSNFYKAVDTWAAPKQGEAGGEWPSDEPNQFAKEVSKHFGWSYHGQALHVAFLWLSLRLRKKHLYAGFRSASDESFRNENLLMLVDEENSASSKELLYVVEFRNVPDFMTARLTSSLTGIDQPYTQRIRWLLFALGLPSLFVPLAFAFADPPCWTKLIYAVEQFILITGLKYGDFQDRSVNTIVGTRRKDADWGMGL